MNARPRDLPSRADVVVIGAGIVGTSTALYLQDKGLSVVVCEKGRIGGEQSSRNWGWCRSMGRDVREIPLILESLRLWQDMERATGADLGYRTCGIIYLCETESQLESYAPWLSSAQEHGIDSRLITPAEVADLLPGLRREVAGALYTASDGRAEPTRASWSIAQAVERRGGVVITECAVRGLETRAGRVSGVVTERGPIACDAVVLAGGAWSRLFCGNLGIDLPQLRVLGSVLRTCRIDGGPEVSTAGSDIAFRRTADGEYCVAPSGASTAEITLDSFRLFGAYLPVLRKEWKHLRFRIGRQFLSDLSLPRRWALDAITPFEQVRVLDPEPDHRPLDDALSAFRRLHPAFAGAIEAKRWGGLIDVTPDAVPVISATDALPGLVLATGFSGHGFGLGPGAARLAAALVAGDMPLVDPSPFRFSRFSDGSKTKLDVGLSVSASKA